MALSGHDVVTGAFGFTGRYITRQLLDTGREVTTLTGHPGRPEEHGSRIAVRPLDFENPDELIGSLTGISTLYNTYWIRFSHGTRTFDEAIRNTLTLISAAKDAGVQRLVHISITNPSPDSPLAYFRGKAVIEQAIIESGLSYAILRPAVIFGDEGILVNNIAWFMRRFPVFPVPGDGKYKLQPIFVEDLAKLAVTLACSSDKVITDAVGPEIYSFDELLPLIANAVGSRTRLLHLSPPLALLLSKLPGLLVRDVVITRDEVMGLAANLLVSDNPPTGQTRLSNWLAENADWIGCRYMSELRKHYR